VEQRLARDALQLTPELVRTTEQRHVGHVLVVREPDDPSDAVRGPELVRNVEAFEPEHAPPAASQMEERGAAHPADADDDGVVARGHAKDTNPALDNCACRS
jgi:hypothetical protein